MSKFTVTVDIGNTNTKCSLFTDAGNVLSTFDFEKLKSTLTNYALDNSNTTFIICSVKEGSIDFPYPFINVLEYFKDGSLLDMPVHYNNTVGIDRLIAAFYAYTSDNYMKLVIDTGTFTTVDSVDIKGFNGGYILPGLNLLATAYREGEQLDSPSTNYPENMQEVLGQFPQTTEKAIHHGAFLSFLAPIKEVLRTHQVKNIILTGGNGEILQNYLKNWEFCQDASIQYVPNLVHMGLFEISSRINSK